MDPQIEGSGAKRRGPWLRYGCLGCLGIGGLFLTVLLVASLVAFVTAPPERVEDRTRTPELAPQRGHVALEIREAELRVEPVAPGEPLRVEARYDVNAFALEEELVPAADGSAAWTYRASFGRSEGAGAFAGLVSLVRGTPARIHVYLPTDVPLDLTMHVKGGGAVVRLGGLWLRTAELELESGAFELSVDEPVREPMESLSIRTASAGALLNGLGNASPRRLDVSYRMGGLDMDLGGHWLADAEIDIRGEVGGGTVHLPSDVILEGLDLDLARRAAPTAPEVQPPTLRFSVSTGLGYLELSDIRLREMPRIEAGGPDE
jgi:hypothetical protein